MDCSCGGSVSESNHQVKTAAGAGVYGIWDSPLPLTVETKRCRACGRVLITIFDANMQQIRQWNGNK